MGDVQVDDGRVGDVRGVVRPAVAQDAAALAACHVACWQESYRHVLSASHLDAMDIGRATAGWQRLLDERTTEVPVVAEVDSTVVGFAVAQASRDEPPVRAVELWALYLRASHHGSGLGRALLRRALGDRPASLWVWEDNPRAHAFYARQGFAPDGARQVVERWEGAPVVRLVR